MNHQTLHYPSGWEWHIIQYKPDLSEQPLSRLASSVKDRRGRKASQRSSTPLEIRPEASLSAEAELEQLKRDLPEQAAWLEASSRRASNHIAIHYNVRQEPQLHGTLMIQLSEANDDIQPFHFLLTHTSLFTMHEDKRVPIRLQTVQHAALLDECSSALEAFPVMLNVVLETFHRGLDGFEARLGILEQLMQKGNRAGLMDEIMERRYELLHWNHLFIPVKELQHAAKEVFMESLTDTAAFQRMSHKLERIEVLLAQYSAEIDTLISMDDALASLRGNDIMKTLTIFTVLFTPATIAGALWGSNFINLPWKDHAWGFAAMNAVILLLTLLIYLWLWRKGWTGDLLRNGARSRKKQRTTDKQQRYRTNGPAPGHSPDQEIGKPLPSRRSRR